MPLYEFKREDNGEVVERFFQSWRKAPRVLTAKNDPNRALPEGVTAKRILSGGLKDRHGRGSQPLYGKWPIHSDALAYHPNQVTRKLKEHIGADIDPDGRPILENPQHRRKVLKAVGAVDRSGYE